MSRWIRRRKPDGSFEFACIKISSPEQAVVELWYQDRGDYDIDSYDYTLAQYNRDHSIVGCGIYRAAVSDELDQQWRREDCYA